ncbi:MAG: hypothetical protein U0835_17855 [Isosphaeraceae bacterium]
MAPRIARFFLLLAASWCTMTFTHETGHIVGGWCCGGTLVAADLRPWGLPYSMFDPDPRPMVTLWCGPVLGVAAPVGFARLARRSEAWFIAYFCVLANGAYLASAWVSGDSHLDTTRLIGLGASPFTVATYCGLTIGFGYAGFRRSCIDALSPPRRQSA